MKSNVHHFNWYERLLYVSQQISFMVKKQSWKLLNNSNLNNYWLIN